MTFATDEASIQDSRPVEGYKIELPTATYYLASGSRDVVIGGVNYQATTISRGAVVLSGNDNQSELIITMLVSHPVAQRFLQNGIPPRDVKVTVYRQQTLSGQVVQYWKGYATGIAVDGRQATLRIPSLTSDTLRRKLPTISASRTCPHTLYDTQCQVSRAGNMTALYSSAPVKRTTTISGISGATITVAALAGADHIFQFGELVHTASSERRSIYEQIGTLLTLQMPINEAQINDSVDVYVGCDHIINSDQGCFRKFANQVNFGGIPDMTWLFGSGVVNFR